MRLLADELRPLAEVLSHANARRIMGARALRTFGYGLVSVLLGIYLAEVGLGLVEVGLILTGALVGSSAITLLLAGSADRLGRRRTLIGAAALMAAAGLVFALADGFWLFLAAALTGTIAPTNSEQGVFASVEQAMLAETAADHRRTYSFSLYAIVGGLLAALGALASGGVGLLHQAGVDRIAAMRMVFVVYSLLALATIPLTAGLSPGVEAPIARGRSGFGFGTSREIILPMMGLFAVDAFAGGFIVQSLVAYWFTLEFGAAVADLGPIFFAAGLLNVVSYLAAPPVAAKFGLLNTAVFSHLPSNFLLALVPLMPTFPLAVLVFLLRQVLSQMDVPTRQSYLMAVIPSPDRAAAAGLTNVARTVAQSLSPAISAWTISAIAVGAPFWIAGGLKAAYDLALWRAFCGTRPPEERGGSAT